MTLAASSGKHNLASVCLSRLFSITHHRMRTLNVTHQGAARDAASVHFRPTSTRTDIFFLI